MNSLQAFILISIELFGFHRTRNMVGQRHCVLTDFRIADFLRRGDEDKIRAHNELGG